MSDQEWFIIDLASNAIINCSTGARSADDALRGFAHPERLRATLTPTAAQLQNYRFWNERP